MVTKIYIGKDVVLNQAQKCQTITERALRLMYSKNKMSMDRIANIYGCSLGTVLNRTRKFNIPSRRPTVVDVTGLKFDRWLVIKRVADDKWRADKFLCLCDCGRYGKVSSWLLRTGGSRSCGCLTKEVASGRRGPQHKSFKNGRTNKEGYVLLSNKYDHPNANKRGRILEHVFVMSQYLGRPLNTEETVHHKNGIRSDNRIENLELWTGSHGAGYRVSDMVVFCFEFLKQHAPELLK